LRDQLARYSGSTYTPVVASRGESIGTTTEDRVGNVPHTAVIRCDLPVPLWKHKYPRVILTILSKEEKKKENRLIL
jgi:hypothetical protein